MRKRSSDACDSVNSTSLALSLRFAVLFLVSSLRSLPLFVRGKVWFSFLAVSFATLIFLIPGSYRSCLAQDIQHSDAAAQLTELLNGVPDVILFVIPTSGDSARVSMAYNRRMAHKQVKQEIDNLRLNGWGVSEDIRISDGAMRPGGTVTTAAQFSLIKSPQVVNNAPALLPYLQALQELGHVSVVFYMQELKPYNGVEDFQTRELVVRRMPADNAYRFEALIQDHKGKLPSLGAAASTMTNNAPPAVTAPVNSPLGLPLLPLMLILSGLGIIGGLLVFGWIANRARRTAPTRKVR